MLEEKLRLQRIAKYGPSSEKLATLQMELLEEEPGVSDEEVQAESQRERLPSVRNRRKHPGRQSLPANLPRVERVIACTPAQCVCGQCGAETTVIGYEESEHLDVEPAKYFVVVTKREKRACKSCEEQGVMAAPLPPRIIEKSLVSDRVVIDTLINKYSSHLPLYRQSAILLRDVGVEISRATMDGWVMQVGESLIPLVEAMRQELIGSGYIQADETPVGVQMHDRRGRNHQGYLWQYGSPGREVVFDFRMSRASGGAEAVLEDVPRSSPNRWLCRLRRPGRSARDSRCVLGARTQEAGRIGAPQSEGWSRHRLAPTRQRPVCHRCESAGREPGSGGT